MKTFLRWLNESHTSQVNVDMSQVEAALQEAGEISYASNIKHIEESKSINIEQYIKDLQSTFPDYDRMPDLINAIRSKQEDTVYEAFKAIRKWNETQEYDSEKLTLLRKMLVVIDSFRELETPQEVRERIDDMIKTSYDESVQNMQNYKNIITEAIGRMNNWNNSIITIIASPAIDYSNRPTLDATNHAIISFGKQTYFSMSQDEGKIEIDEVLDAGEEEFFPTPEMETDYFSLINEIRNPGVSSREKTLTLYTARPRTDRNYYLQATYLPKNIFLTNDYDHAEGLAADLAGERDIWKVRINSKYVTQTLFGKIKYYQVTTNDAPATLELI